uniref:S-acyltransferase n=2 Tax=Oryza TaxID=4527 RepID=A0A0D3GFT8_9ORYZ
MEQQPLLEIMRPLVGDVDSVSFLQVMHLFLSVAGVEQSHKVTKFQENLTVYAFLIGGISGTGGGVWAIYPVVFSISTFCGIFHCILTGLLAVFTITSYCLASFKSAGAPADMRWGSYPMVGKNDLENYTFCTYCSKPKPPRAHHCRSCKILGTVWELQITMLFYAAGMTIYSSYRIWPPLDFENLASTRRSMGYIKMLIEIIGTLASSAFFLSARGFVTVYLAFASLSVNAGIGVLLFQQLSYIYEGNTYLNRLSSPNVMHGERGLQNLIRFFGCPYSSIIGLLKHWQVTGQFELKTSLEVHNHNSSSTASFHMLVHAFHKPFFMNSFPIDYVIVGVKNLVLN